MYNHFLLLLCSSFGLCANITNKSQCENTAHLFSTQHAICISTDELEEPPLGWSQTPRCFNGASKTYCAHTLLYYRSSRGLSLISTPEAANGVLEAHEHALGEEKYSLGTARSSSEKRKTEYPAEDLYEVRDIPGKGKGVIAKRPISKGDVILLDSPALLTSARLPIYLAPPEGAKLLETAVRNLAHDDQKAILALDKPPGTDGVDVILKTNSFSCQFNDKGVGDEYLCLFPRVSRINHACRPNANAKFIPRTLLMEIRALRDVVPGEEISISYGEVDLKYADRQRLYSGNWGFTCTCDLCTAGEAEVRESDERRERFAQLHRSLGSLTAENFDAQRVLRWEYEVLEISEKEGMEVLVTEDLERMAYIFDGLGRRAEAINWARKAKESLLRWKLGPYASSDDLKRIEELLSQLEQT